MDAKTTKEERMAEQSKNMDTVQVRLRGSEQIGQPKFANYSHVGVSNNMAYLDFGFIEPAHIAQASQRSSEKNGAGKSLEGTTVTRVAMGLIDLLRFHQQVNGIIAALKEQAPTKSDK